MGRFLVVALAVAGLGGPIGCGEEDRPRRGSSEGTNGRNGGGPELGLSIQFDYRYDTQGFFADAVRQQALEAAANAWSYLLKDDFDPILAGTPIYVRNPEETSESLYPELTEDIDDILVFVGAGPRASTLAGSSATAGFPSDDPELRAALEDRWDGPDFEPWTGWIQFDSDTDWYFDPTPGTGDDIPAASRDFISTACHELGHILGYAPGGAFGSFIDAQDRFTGPRAVDVYGQPVPIENQMHIGASVMIDGEVPLMRGSRPVGPRYLPTVLDVALLEDIGYEAE